MKVKSKKLHLTTVEEWAFSSAYAGLANLLRSARALKLSGESLDGMKVLEEAVQACEAFALIHSKE